MAVALNYYLGIFRNHQDICKELRVFGAFLAGVQIQFCVMFPVFCDDTVSFVFQTDIAWRFDLGVSNDQESVSTSKDIHFRSNDMNPFDKILLVDTTGDQESEDYQANDEQAVDVVEDQVPKAAASPLYDCHEIENLHPITKNVISIMAFLRDVQTTISYVHEQLERLGDALDSPNFYPSDYERRAPTSSDKHSKSSPKRDMKTPKSEKGGKRRRVTQKSFESEVTSTAVDGKSRCMTISLDGNLQAKVIIKKRKAASRSDEISFLKSLRGVENVVQLYGYSLTSECFYMIQEKLEPFNFKLGESCARLFSIASAFLLDSITALQVLKQLNIIHRDLSPNNILYSPEHRCWKIIDFDLAVHGDLNGQYAAGMNVDPVGTKGFIAPELKNPNGAIYSWKSDLYALGKTFLSMFSEAIFFHVETFEDGQGVDILDSMESVIMKHCCASDSSQRLDYTTIKKLLLEVHELVYEDYSVEESYIRSRYDDIVVMKTLVDAESWS